MDVAMVVVFVTVGVVVAGAMDLCGVVLGVAFDFQSVKGPIGILTLL